MSKKCQKETRQLQNKLENITEPIYSQLNENVALDIVVGSSNVSRWKELKTICCCKSNAEFTTILLNWAEEHIERLAFFVSWPVSIVLQFLIQVADIFVVRGGAYLTDQ